MPRRRRAGKQRRSKPAFTLAAFGNYVVDDRDCGGLIVDALGSLHRSGWSIGSTAFATTAGGRVWVVSGSNRENRIRADGATQAEAWQGAVDQATSVGMFEGWRDSEPGTG
jgi:hypothetical protein